MFKNPFSFNDRIRRRVYGVSWLVCLPATLLGCLVIGVCNDIISLFYAVKPIPMKFIFAFVTAPVLWFIIAQGVKRCHDLGRSGWWVVLPFYGFILLFRNGEPYENDYGVNPKYPYASDDPFKHFTAKSFRNQNQFNTTTPKQAHDI